MLIIALLLTGAVDCCSESGCFYVGTEADCETILTGSVLAGEPMITDNVSQPDPAEGSDGGRQHSGPFLNTRVRNVQILDCESIEFSHPAVIGHQGGWASCSAVESNAAGDRRRLLALLWPIVADRETLIEPREGEQITIQADAHLVSGVLMVFGAKLRALRPANTEEIE